MPAPKWAKGMRRLVDNVYVDDDGAMHFDANAMCRDFGVPCNEENVAVLKKAAEDYFRELAVAVRPSIEVVEE